MKRIFLQVLTAILIVMSFMIDSIAHAETEKYEGFGEYFMTDETVDFAKNQSELAAQRDILDKICVYVKSQSTMIDNELDNDEIITISAGILHVIETKHYFESEVDGIVVKALVTAKIDTEELNNLLEQEIKSRLSK